MNASTSGTLFVRAVIFILGMIMVIPALHLLYTYCSYRYQGSMVYGIVDHPASSRYFGGRPLIRYVDMAGTVHEFKSKAKTHIITRPKKGERIQLFVHRTAQDKAIVNSLFYYLILPLIFATAGCYCCFGALFNDHFRSHQNNRQGCTS